VSIIQIDYIDVAISLGLIAVVLVVSLLSRLFLEKDLLIGTVRCFIQLVIVGYILNWVFGLEHWYAVLAMLLVMMLIAGYSASRRVEGRGEKRIVVASFAVMAASFSVIMVVFSLVIPLDPWYDPRYVIPISGMIINGAMNGVSIGMATLRTQLKDRADAVLAALSLGASSAQASAPMVRESLKRALIPTINGLMTAGIVQLPGMMTGQIVAGVDPRLAVLYQIVVYYMLAASVSLSAIIGVKMYRRRFFNKIHQFSRPG